MEFYGRKFLEQGSLKQAVRNMEYYEIIGDHAFTQDNILIHNLLVTNIPKKATSINVAEYFQKFGKVGNVQMLRNGERLIHFDDPKDAANVLQENFFLFMNSIIRVGVCSSSFQPEGQKLMKLLHQTGNKFKCNSVNTINQQALILTLNDDCLEQICKYLPTDDQINFALTCQRFYDIVVMLSKVQYATLDTTDKFMQTRFKNIIFLKIVGSQIKTLTIGEHLKSEFNLFGLCCTNVEKLKVLGAQNTKSLLKLIKKMHLLQDLELKSIELNADFIKYLVKFKHLKNLNVMDCDGVSGENIHLLCDLEKISLSSYKLASCHFKDICKNLKKLQYLEIKNCTFLETENYDHISKHLLQLETLKLSSTKKNSNLNCITNLPKLKNLEIRGGHINEEFLKSLSKLHADQLEELRIDWENIISFENLSLVAELKKLKLLHIYNSKVTDENVLAISQLTELKNISLENCYKVTDNALLKLLENCLKLEQIYLVVDYNCFTPTLHLEVLKLLEEQHADFRRTDRVEITFDGKYKHRNFIRQHVVQINAPNAIDDTFDSGFPCYSDDDYYYDFD